MRRTGFTLMEVLIATAIAGLVITAGFRLVAMSIRLLNEARSERELVSAGEYMWMCFRLNADTPDSGTDDERGISWETEKLSTTIDEYELHYRRVTVKTASGRSMNIYIPDQ